MTNQQLYLAIGLPIIVSMMNTGIVILYVNAKTSSVEKVFTEKLLRVEQVLDARLRHIEDKLGIGK